MLQRTLLTRYAGTLTALWIVYWVLLGALTHTPKLPHPPFALDRRMLIAHFIAFAILALLCATSARARGRNTDRRWKIRWLIIFAAYAALDELLQPLTNRHRDPLDWLADMAGVAVIFLVFRMRQERSRP